MIAAAFDGRVIDILLVELITAVTAIQSFWLPKQSSWQNQSSITSQNRGSSGIDRF